MSIYTKFLTPSGGTGGDATVAPLSPIPLSSNGPLSQVPAVTHTTGSTDITVPSAGVYQIDYSVNYSSGLGSEVSISVNGSPVTSTTLAAITADGTVEGTAMLELQTGDVISLVNTSSSTSIVMVLSPSIGAQVNLIRIGDLLTP